MGFATRVSVQVHLAAAGDEVVHLLLVFMSVTVGGDPALNDVPRQTPQRQQTGRLRRLIRRPFPRQQGPDDLAFVTYVGYLIAPVSNDHSVAPSCEQESETGRARRQLPRLLVPASHQAIRARYVRKECTLVRRREGI